MIPKPFSIWVAVVERTELLELVECTKSEYFLGTARVLVAHKPVRMLVLHRMVLHIWPLLKLSCHYLRGIFVNANVNRLNMGRTE